MASERWDKLPFIMKLATNFERAVREELPPEKAERYIREQHEVAECRRRAATNSRLLDMRLD